MKKDNEIYRSDEFQEILEGIPSWIVRRGITLLFCVVVGILAGSMLFKYPDQVSVSMTLTSDTPVATLTARTSGRLQQLCVTNHQKVSQGDFLGILENGAFAADILFLKEYLSAINDHPDSPPLLPDRSLQLGSLQSLWLDYTAALDEWNAFLAANYYPAKIALLENRKKLLLAEQEADSEDVPSTFQSDPVLNNGHDEGIIVNRKSSDRKLLSLSDREEELLDLRHQYTTQQQTLRKQMELSIRHLRMALREWEATHLFTAPISGTVSLGKYWSLGQQIPVGDVVFHITPLTIGNLLGKALLPVEGSDQVKTGQAVNIRFLNFSPEEYGLVRGEVTAISQIPVMENQHSYYLVDIALPQGLLTNTGKELPYLPEMRAQADIITEDISLFSRFMLPLRRIWKSKNH